jgi:hypothetical protein
MDSNREPADIEFAAAVNADQLRFRQVPRVEIHFSGAPDHQSATSSRRINLPDPVVANLDYHDVRVDYLLTNRLRDADKTNRLQQRIFSARGTHQR